VSRVSITMGENSFIDTKIESVLVAILTDIYYKGTVC